MRMSSEMGNGKWEMGDLSLYFFLRIDIKNIGYASQFETQVMSLTYFVTNMTSPKTNR